MRPLHDHPLLGRGEIAIPEGGVATQIERIRIAPHPLSLDDLSKLWTAFKAEYRISTAYWASVVLIDSRLPGRTPLPVLQRGQEDQGALVQADVVPPFATLTGIQPPDDQLDLRPAEPLTLLGLDRVVDVAPDKSGRSFDALTVTLTPQGEWDWPAGFYSVAVRVAGGNDQPTGDALGVAVAPGIQNIAPNPADLDASGVASLTVTCSPGIRPGQRVALLLGSHEIQHPRIDAPTAQLTFVVRGVPANKYRARLRVDGATSRFINHKTTPPTFSGIEVKLQHAGG
jgi:hypothetical protein